MQKTKMKTLALVLGGTLLIGTGLSAYAANDGHKDKDSSGSVGQYVDDATITARVKSSFAKDPDVSAMRISVDTVKGVVELSGNVETAAAKSQAVALAKAVPDVRSVRNNLTVKPSANRPAETTNR